MKQQYTQNPIQIGNTLRNYIIIALVVFLIVAIVFTAFTFLTPPKKTVVCGDNVCDSSENCYDCSQDCKCSGSNSYCDSKQKKCVTSRCGDGVCGPFESMENCCDDCGCSSSYETCNKTTHTCQMPEANISDDRVREIATEYFTNKSETISQFGIISPTVYQDKPAKSIGVKIEGDAAVHLLIVTEGGQVFERPMN
jgi:hypothetical protein